jgi:hypothetical protein
MAAIGILGGDFVARSGDSMTGDLVLTMGADLQAQDDIFVGDDATITGDIGVSGLGTFGVSVNTPLVTATTVNASGTVTGSDLVATDDLTVAGDSTVTGDSTVSFYGFTANVGQILSQTSTTGIFSGGDVNINPGLTTADITAFEGQIVQYDSSGILSPTNPTIVYVSVPAQTGIALTGPPTQAITWFVCDSAGTIAQQGVPPTPTQRRTHLVLGAVAQIGGTIVDAQTLPTNLSQPSARVNDLMDSLGPFAINGNVLSANGINLSFNKTIGDFFSRSFNQIPFFNNPSIVSLPAQTPATFLPLTPLGPSGAPTTILDVARYDPNGAGTLVAVGGGANSAQNFRVWATASNVATSRILVQYGQSVYGSLALAVAGIGRGGYVVGANIPIIAGLLGWISVTRTATNLSDTSQAVFTKASKFSTP